MEKIAFIGTGVMGGSMAGRLLDAGHRLVVSTRTKKKAAPLLERGAAWADTPTEAARGADIVITIVGYPTDVEQVYLGPDGIVANAARGTLLIDMTTSSPSLARRIAEKAAAAGLDALDAPVSGGDTGARNGTLSIMVGGAQRAFSRAEPIFAAMGKNIVLQGDAGSGQYCKLCNQMAIASSMMGIVEALVFAARSGLNPRTVLRSIEAGAAGSWGLSNLYPRMLDGNVAPGFYVKHFIKDMGIALDSAKELGIALPGLMQAETLYRALAGMDIAAIGAAAAAVRDVDGMTSALFPADAENGGDLGTQALFLLYLAGKA